MKNYIGSEEHKRNSKKASEIGVKKMHQLKEERIKLYYENPKKCLFCREVIEYKFKNTRKFCNSSCSASYSNKRRKQTEESKNKRSKTMKETFALNPKKKKSLKAKDKYSLIDYVNCVHCGKLFVKKRYNRRTTCSESCRVEEIMQNRKANTLRSKRVIYYNKWEEKDILLDSIWEVKTAELLDKKNIKWIRPKSIEWIDERGKHLYYPDFYLPDYKIYLDPKNPLVMEIDKEKLNILININKINLIYGHINKIEKSILSLK